MTILDLSDGSVAQADGAVKTALQNVLAGHEPGPLLAALGAQHALVDKLRHWGRLSQEPLTPRNALSLGGFDTLFVELTGQCNERCLHCYANSSPQVTAKLTKEQAFGVLRDAAQLQFHRVQFTGGDPLLCAFLPELVHEARALSISVVEIYTNGLLLSQHLLDQLAGAKPKLAFSFYSSRPEVHDAITRVPGSQRRTVAAMERALRADLEVRASLVVLPENAHTVEETRKYLQNLGVQQFGVSGTRPVGRGKLFNVPFGLPMPTNNGAHDRAAASPAALGGTLCVTYDGDVIPCIFNRQDILGNIVDRSLRNIAQAPALPQASQTTPTETLQQCRARLQCQNCQLTAVALRIGNMNQDGAC